MERFLQIRDLLLEAKASPKGNLLGTPNREPQEYSRSIKEYKDPGRYIPIVFLLHSWSSLFGFPSKVPLKHMCRLCLERLQLVNKRRIPALNPKPFRVPKARLKKGLGFGVRGLRGRV